MPCYDLMFKPENCHHAVYLLLTCHVLMLKQELSPCSRSEEHEEHEFIRLHISKYTMVVIVFNEQCNTGDPLETSGGVYRGPPYMFNTIKCCAYVKH